MAWADERILESLRQPDVPKRALDLYAHVLGAEHVWLARLEQRPPTVAVWPVMSVDECAQLARENRSAFRAYLDRLTSTISAAASTDRNSAGDEFDNAIEDIVLHVRCTCYHRVSHSLVRDSARNPSPPTTSRSCGARRRRRALQFRAGSLRRRPRQ